MIETAISRLESLLAANPVSPLRDSAKICIYGSTDVLIRSKAIEDCLKIVKECQKSPDIAACPFLESDLNQKGGCT